MSIAAILEKMSPTERQALLLKEMRKSHTELKELSATVNPRIVTLLDGILTYLEQEKDGWK